jgi:hypothetical protein
VTALFQQWTMTVTFDGVAIDCLSARPGHGVDRGKATAIIETTKTIADTLTDGAAVVITVTLNGGTPLTRFTGVYRNPERNCSTSGQLATLTCEGTSYVLGYPIEKDIAFTGGAKTAPDNLQTSPMHIGNDTISWYADTSPNGTTVNLTETPAVNSSFVWIEGRLHGTNSYPTSLDDKKIKDWSRIEVWQDGDKLGYANFPENGEQFSSELDYTNDANWSDFELMITADIVAADGDLTFKFISGTRPGGSLKDEYEVKSVTWQTAGKNSVREILRGMFKRVLGPSKYRVVNVTDLDGNTMYLGGNGLADAGQVRVARTETPLAFMTRIAGLFGYKVFDCPDGIIRVVPIRGVPNSTPIATFAEGTNILSARRTYEIRDVYNSVRVEGWSGTDQNRKRVAYSSQTATVDIEPSTVIPDPPGIALLRISDSLLTSNSLCADVRRIAEINHAEAAVLIEWDTWPHNVRAGQVVTVNASSVGFSGDVFLMDVTDDLSTGGFRTHMIGWAGGAVPFDGDADADDPDPDEVDTEPTDPRPVDEWLAYRPKAVYLNA